MFEQDQSAAEVKEAGKVFGVVLVAHHETAEVVEPGEEPFDLPAVAVAPPRAAVLGAVFGQAVAAMRRNDLDAVLTHHLLVEPVGFGWSSPVVAQGRVFLVDAQLAKPTATERVLCFDEARGKALDDSVSSSLPVVIEAGGRRQLIVWSDDSVASLNPATGAIWWREPMVTSGNDSIPTLVVQENRLLISGLMFALDGKRPLATVLWPTNRAAAKRLLSNTSTPVLRGDHIYSAKSLGELACLDARTGGLVWQTNSVTQLKSGASIHLTSTPEAVFLFTDRGNLIRAQFTPQC